MKFLIILINTFVIPEKLIAAPGEGFFRAINNRNNYY